LSGQRRTQSRYDVEIDASVRIEGDEEGQQASVTVANLSLGGCFLNYDERLPINRRVEVTFRVPTHEKPISVGGTVRWSADGGAGVQFDGLRAGEVWSLNKYFERLRDE